MGEPRAEVGDPDRLVVLVDCETREDGNPDPRAREALHDAVLVGAEHEVRLAAGRAELLDDDLGGAAVAVPDERLLDDLAEGRDPAGGGQARVPGSDEDVVVLEDEDRLERGVVERELHEGEVELAALDQVGKDVVRVRLAKLDVDLRPCAGEPPHHLREDLRPDALEDPHAERAGLACGEGREIGLGGLQARDDHACVAQQQLPGLGQRDRSRPPGPLDELLADDALERCDLLADRRLRVPELAGRAAERALGLERVESGQMAQLDAEPGVGTGFDLDRVH